MIKKCVTKNDQQGFKEFAGALCSFLIKPLLIKKFVGGMPRRAIELELEEEEEEDFFFKKKRK